MTDLITPYGQTLVDLTEPPDSAEELARFAATIPSLRISERTRCDLELLATGAFSPLRTFMNREDHDRVVRGSAACRSAH